MPLGDHDTSDANDGDPQAEVAYECVLAFDVDFFDDAADGPSRPAHGRCRIVTQVTSGSGQEFE